MLTRQKIAIFVDGDFWHGKDIEKIKRQIKSNRGYWIPKIERNMQRDIEVTEELKQQGWTVIRFWGKDIKSNVKKCADTIEKAVGKNDEKI